MIGFLKRFFKKQEKYSKKNVNELLSAFNDKIKNIKNDIYEFKGSYLEISKLFEKTKEVLSELKNTESSEEVYPQLKSAVNGAKDIVLRIRIPEIKEPKIFEDFIGIDNQIKDFLKGIDLIKPKYIELISILYKNEIKDLIGNFKEIKLFGEEFNKKLTNKNKKIEELEKIIFNLNLLKNKLIEIGKLKEKTNESEKEKIDLKNSKKIKEEELAKIKNSEEYKKTLEIKKEIEEINEKISLLKKSFLDRFNSIEKALKMYYHGSEKNEINELFQNPFLVKEKDILEVLNNIKSLILKEKIKLKQSKKEKTLKAIENIDETAIKKFKKEYENLEELRAKKEEELSNTKTKDLSQIESEIERMGNLINFLEKDINNNLEETKKQEELFKSTKKETEELVFNSLNEKVFIEF